MRYWGILAAKLMAAAAVLYVIWSGLRASYTPPYEVTLWNHSPFLHDLNWTTMVFLFWLFTYGLLKVPELQFTGKEPNDWKPNEDMWKELTSIDKGSHE